jgi:hypothetical protein
MVRCVVGKLAVRWLPEGAHTEAVACDPAGPHTRMVAAANSTTLSTTEVREIIALQVRRCDRLDQHRAAEAAPMSSGGGPGSLESPAPIDARPLQRLRCRPFNLF